MQLDDGITQSLFDSELVSHVQVVPKKNNITVIWNNKNELVPTRAQYGCWVCIGYTKLNIATRKNHFSLPFVDQMLKRLAGYSFYYFLDGYYGYIWIFIAPTNVPFGLCNVDATLQNVHHFHFLTLS